MRVSGVFKKQEEVPAEVIPGSRLIPWVVIGILILVALALYFRYGLLMTPLL
ncbi:MAG: hypothetical protein ACRENQ_13445 [Gemmatimonadaceae bacterium]